MALFVSLEGSELDEASRKKRNLLIGAGVVGAITLGITAAILLIKRGKIKEARQQLQVVTKKAQTSGVNPQVAKDLEQMVKSQDNTLRSIANAKEEIAKSSAEADKAIEGLRRTTNAFKEAMQKSKQLDAQTAAQLKNVDAAGAKMHAAISKL